MKAVLPKAPARFADILRAQEQIDIRKGTQAGIGVP